MLRRSSETCLMGAIHKEFLPTKKNAAGSSCGSDKEKRNLNVKPKYTKQFRQKAMTAMPALLKKSDAQEYVGAMPERTFLKYYGDHAIRLGKADYWRPRDLDQITSELAYGEQPDRKPQP